MMIAVLCSCVTGFERDAPQEMDYVLLHCCWLCVAKFGMLSE